MNTWKSYITNKQKSAVNKLNVDRWLKGEIHERIEYYKDRAI